jgi:glycogen debranching enzyme
MCRSIYSCARGLAFSAGILLFLAQHGLTAQGLPNPGQAGMELSRPIRTWEFVSSTGQRAGLLGNERGTLEAWVYPLKILRDFQVRFHVGGLVIPAEALARTLLVHPESSTIVYSGDSFSVRQTLFAPVHEPGAVIGFEVHTTQPLEIEVSFRSDFQLEWPASLQGVSEDWDPSLHAFRFTEESGRFEAIVGSPTATTNSEEYSTNYFSSPRDCFLLGVTPGGEALKLVVIAATFDARQSLPELYRHLANDYSSLLTASGNYYRDSLSHTIGLELPDKQMQSAYDWARVSMLQGIVDNPLVGKGLVAGYNQSGRDYRPGFAWFFGRDAEWTSLAFGAEGDFATARAALDFVSAHQRADGKMPHEISQSATFLDWFNKTPYAYAAADSTPLFIIAADDYVTRSGDVEFAREKWDVFLRAYQFLLSTYDAQGLAQNSGVGTGWIEGGPLYPVRTELYQAGLGVEALRALSHLASIAGKEDQARELREAFQEKQKILENAFWSPEKKIYAYAIEPENKRADTVSVLSAVPMWFRLLDEDRARGMIEQLAAPDQQTDWGMRILSSRDPRYDPSGYHFGSVWPLFTGWAAVGEYRYHQALPAYLNLRSNALLTLDGSLGHTTEVLSGDYYQTLSTGTPHQIWSAAMVVNPLLSGLFGLTEDANGCNLGFAPHVPVGWDAFSVNNIHLGKVSADLRYESTAGKIALTIESNGIGVRNCTLDFSPAVSLRATIQKVESAGRAVPFQVDSNSTDQHVTVKIPVRNGRSTIEIHLKNNFEIGMSSTLPPLGGSSRGLRLISQSWSPSRDLLTVSVAGTPGETYELFASDRSQIISVDRAAVDAQIPIVFHLARR